MGIKLRIFFSSPGDVAEERLLASRTVDRLQIEFVGLLEIEAIFWEHEPLRATASFQEQILRPSEADIVVLIFWSRLGTRLPAHIVRDDGSPYASGTEFEFEDAVKGYRVHGSPDLLVYRKVAEPLAPLNKAVIDRLAQKEALEAFFEKWFGASNGSLSSAFHSFASSPEFEESLERHLRKLIQARLHNGRPRQIGSPAARPVWTKGSPFRGLDVFGVEHAELFFGRTVAVSEVLSAMRKQAGVGRAFVVVTGMSGVGKSSLCRAGVLPAITRPGVIEGVGVWRSAIVRAGEALGNLALLIAHALLHPCVLPQLANDGTSAEELATLMREDPKILPPLIRARLQDVASEVQHAENLAHTPVARLILLVDQLEEIFTGEQVSPAERRLFADILSALARSGCVWLLATLRSDFYSRLEETPEILELKEGNGQYDLRPPTPAEIGQIIRYPAQVAGLTFEQDPSTGETLDDTLRDAGVANPGALPLLEFTLQQLFEQRTSDGVLTLSAYHELGGIEGALGKYAEDVFQQLPLEAQSPLPNLLNALISVGLGEENSVSRKFARITVLSSAAPVRQLVDRFVEARLLIANRTEEDGATVQFVHEAVLQRWPRVQQWVEQNKEMLKARARLATAATLWQAEKENLAFLLPKDHVEHAQEIFVSHRNELSSVEIRYIEKSFTTMRQKQQKQRRRIHAATLLAAAMVITAVFYTYAWAWPYTAYYNNFTKVNGVPQGIGKLDARDVRVRHWSLKIIRQGHWGPATRIEAVDGYGELTREHNIVNFIQQDPSSPSTIQGCFWVFDYEGSVLRQETAFDQFGVAVLRLVFERKFENSTPALAAGFDSNVYYAKFSNSQGLASALVPSGTAYVRFTRSKEGLDERIDFLDSEIHPSPNDQGVYGQIRRYDSTGNVIEVKELGPDSQPSTKNNIGIAEFKLAYDDMGSATLVMYYDANGKPSPSKDGSFGFRNTYDEHHNLTAVAALDVSGSPFMTNRGYATETIAYGQHGEIALRAYFDSASHPVLTKGGYSIIEYHYDHKSLISEEMYLDTNRKPIILQDGCSGYRVHHDNSRDIIETTCLSSTRDPGLTRDGYSITEHHHDRKAMTSEERYLDSNRKPVALKTGCFGLRSRSDNFGHLIEIVCLDSNGGIATTTIKGISIVRFSYDSKGAKAETSFFDRDGKLVSQSKQ